MPLIKLISIATAAFGICLWSLGIFWVPAPHNIGVIMLADIIIGLGAGLLLSKLSHYSS